MVSQEWTNAGYACMAISTKAKMASLLGSSKKLQDAVLANPDERRVQPRFTTQFRSTFSGSHDEGSGRTLDLSIATPFSGGSLLGLWFGKILERKISGPRVQQIFSVFTFLVAISLIYKCTL